MLRVRLLRLATLFMFVYALILSLSPVIRYHSWNVEYKWMHWGGVIIWLVGFSLLHRQLQKAHPESDPYLLPVAALLSGWGLLTIWRLTPNYGLRQTIWLAVSLAIFYFGLKKPVILDWLHRYKYIWLVGMLLLTILTFFFGTYPGGVGPNLWLGCCGVYFQPSEALKLLLIVYLAAYLADRIPTTLNFMQLLAPSMLLVGLAIFLLVAQRDLGTASLLIAIYTLIIYLASGKRRILVISLIIILVAAVAGYQLFDVIRLRVDAWLNPWLDPGGRSYQIVQSILSFAAGGLLGSGPGLGSPGVVPVALSDFIYTAISEETGLIGGLGLVLLIAILVYRGLLIALRSGDTYRRILAGGISVYFAAQSILIIGGTLRLLPLTGVTLPFVSYGGTSLLFSFFSLLLLTLVNTAGDEKPAPLQRPVPYFFTGTLVLIALLLIAFIHGWWALVRAPALATRADNPRRAISDRYVVRGQLMDRNNTPLAVTSGQAGDYTRQVLYPSLGPVIGYSNATYGQGGLEYGLDDYLRGLRGNPASSIWFSQIVYTQAPHGLDVRLSLDSTSQEKSDQLLLDKTGALVLLNASTGEILTMSSAPTYDPNTLEDHWAEWIADKRSPLLNRATQGKYPVGTALAPFLLADALQLPALPALPTTLHVAASSWILDCAIPVDASARWSDLVRNGCPTASTTLSSKLTPSDIRSLYTRLGFFDTPQLPLEVASPSTPLMGFTSYQSATGEDGLGISPLQMALAATVISNHGTRPSPRLALAVNTPRQGWVILPANPSVQAMPAKVTLAASEMLAVPGLPIWETTAHIYTEDGQPLTWYLAGTLPSWNGTPYALALILENDSPENALEIGRTVLLSIMNLQ